MTFCFLFQPPPWLLDRLGEVRGKILVFNDDVNKSGDVSEHQILATVSLLRENC